MRPLDRLARDTLQRARETLLASLEDSDVADSFTLACDLAVTSLGNDGRLYTLGNGGSAADAMHIAAELVGRIDRERPPLPAEALVADPVTLTALANDFGFDAIFSRRLESCLAPGDVVLALSTSGRSANVVSALRTCRERGGHGILFTGPQGTPAEAQAEVTVAVGDHGAKLIQELHRVLAHAFCEVIETALHPGRDERTP